MTTQQATQDGGPAAGVFDAWPEHLGDLRILDPCCGSGHFLIAALSMLVPMRMEREGLTTCDAVDAVLRDNLHGLELDPRCVAIAAFALAVASWRYPGAEGYRPLPELNLACSGLSVGATRERWAELAGGKRNLRLSLEWMHDAFREAPVLGSLVNPFETAAAELVNWNDLSAVLAQALAQEPSEERREAAIAAQGLAKATEMLAASYHLVVTNVPYLARGKQAEGLRDLLRAALLHLQPRPGHRISGTLPGAVHGRRDCQPGTASELAVSHQLPETPRKTVEDGDVASACMAGTGRLRDH